MWPSNLDNNDSKYKFHLHFESMTSNTDWANACGVIEQKLAQL